MHCRNCEYPLWNLTARQCPECGLAFRPQEYQFQPGRVAFCCPGCGQDYYGTSETGHLLPAEFDCVRCGRHLHEDEMVLRPAEGVAEDGTSPERAPWLERKKRGWFKAWSRTVIRSLTQPQRLIRSVPPESSVRAAFGFVIATFAMVVLLAIIPLTCIALVLPLLAGPSNQGGPGPSMVAGVMVGSMMGVLLFALIAWIAVLGVWGALTHILLRVTGTTAGGISRTYQALCYGGGTYVVALIPCIGQYVATIWWMVTAALMVRAGQGVSGWRAAFATLLPPVGTFVLLISLYIVMIASFVGRGSTEGIAAGSGFFAAMTETQLLASQIQAWAADNDGAGPAHALQLVPDAAIGTGNFISADFMTTQQEVPVADLTLSEFQIKGDNLQGRIAGELAAEQPVNVVAHRVGDFVFTYHGIDFESAPAGLWIVVCSPDPRANPGIRGIVYATVDGMAMSVGASQIAEALRAQNELRALSGLAPLPPPATVTHERPAVAPAETTPEG